MKKLRIKKVDATYFSLSKYIRLEGQFQAKNFQTAYFLQVRILGFWFTIQTYISIDGNYALLCASDGKATRKTLITVCMYKRIIYRFHVRDQPA